MRRENRGQRVVYWSEKKDRSERGRGSILGLQGRERERRRVSRDRASGEERGALTEVDLPRGLLVSGNGKDGDLRSVLGDESGGVSAVRTNERRSARVSKVEKNASLAERGGKDEDGSGVLLHGGGDSGDGEGLGGLGGSGSQVPEVGEERLKRARSGRDEGQLELVKARQQQERILTA